MTTQPLDMPNGPGWWAGKNQEREFVVKWTEFEVSDDSVHVCWDDDDYTITHTLSWFKGYYRDTKWYRLQMPWDQPATDAAQYIQFERNIGFVKGVLEGVKTRRECRRCDEVIAWLDTLTQPTKEE